jgi:hypothetical protein
MRFGQFLTTGSGIPSDMKVEFDKNVFNQMVNFIVGIEPNQLTEEQKSKIVDIIRTFTLSVESQFNLAEDELCKQNMSKMNEYYDKNKESLDQAHGMNRNMMTLRQW